MTQWPLAAAVVAGVLLSGCASNDRPPPSPLASIQPQLTARSAWMLSVGAVQFPLAVAVTPGVFTVASSNGAVVAIQADTGRELWRGQVGEDLSAGVGSDGRFASVVTRDGDLVTLEAGRELWRASLGLRVTTAPLVAGERVFVLASDRSVHAFDASDGTRLWSVRRPGDPLTLAQGGVISAFKDTLLVGQGPRLAGLDPNNGDVRWEITIGSPRGTNEVERLADLVGPLSRAGDTVCVRSFQASVGCVDAERGRLGWTRPVGGIVGVSADEQRVYGADASDRITAWKASSGEVAWQSEAYLYRGLSAPLATPRAVVFGDAEGVVHWLSRDNGEALLRTTTDGSAIAAAPVASGSAVLVVTRSGGLYAFRLE
jgi:outer membrane protein assembly factor BamB